MKQSLYITLLIASILTGCQASYQEKFLHIAEQENAACPRRLNETTVMDSTRYDADLNRVHYYYTLSGELDDAEYLKKNAALHKQELQKAVYHLLETQEYLKHGTSFHIVYHSASSGEMLAEFIF